MCLKKKEAQKKKKNKKCKKETHNLTTVPITTPETAPKAVPTNGTKLPAAAPTNPYFNVFQVKRFCVTISCTLSTAKLTYVLTNSVFKQKNFFLCVFGFLFLYVKLSETTAQNGAKTLFCVFFARQYNVYKSLSFLFVGELKT